MQDLSFWSVYLDFLTMISLFGLSFLLFTKEKAAAYYAQNKKAIKEKSRECYKNLSQEEKDKIKEYQRKKYQELVQYKKEALKNNFFVFYLI